MIAVDTNILVRYFAEDEPVQTEVARLFLEGEVSLEMPAFVSLVTLVELLWVLNDTYRIERAMQAKIIRELLTAPNIFLEADQLVRNALDLGHRDLADAIIHLIGQANGCTKTVTFDNKFARLVGVELLTA
jgi:predicted nucleic-acid-binding protein